MAETLVKQAVKNASASGNSVGEELIKLENEMKDRLMRSELRQSRSDPARQAAEKAAKTTTQEGVKKTIYPYVSPSRGVSATPGGGRGGAMRGIGGGGGVLPGLEDAMKKGGKVQGYASGGKVRGGGCEQRGKTKGRMV